MIVGGGKVVEMVEKKVELGGGVVVDFVSRVVVEL